MVSPPLISFQMLCSSARGKFLENKNVSRRQTLSNVFKGQINLINQESVFKDNKQATLKCPPVF